MKTHAAVCDTVTKLVLKQLPVLKVTGCCRWQNKLAAEAVPTS